MSQKIGNKKSQYQSLTAANADNIMYLHLLEQGGIPAYTVELTGKCQVSVAVMCHFIS